MKNNSLNSEQADSSLLKELRAANQQLRASEQQLQAANQQLKANEQQLRAANQQLEAYSQQLALSESRFRSYIEKAPDGVFIVDENGKYLEANPAACRISGYTENELLSMHIPDVLQKTEIKKGIAHFEKVKKEGWAEGEIGFVHKNGEHRYWQVAAQKLSDTRFLGFVKDVTSHKKAEDALKEREELLQSTGRMAKVGGWQLDVVSKKLTWSRETYRIHEVPPGKKPALKEAMNFFHPDDRSILSNSIKKAMETGEPYDHYLRFTTAKGNHLITRTICQPKIQRGKVVKLKGTFQDVTELKRAEEKLETLLARYKTLFDAVPVGITLSDHKGKIIESNDIAEDILGLSHESHRKRSIDDDEWMIIRPDGSPMPPEEFASVKALKEKRLVKNVEMGIVKSRGQITWINVSAAPVPQKKEGVIIAYNDITEKIYAERELKVSRERLELAMDAGNHGFWDWDLETNETYFSPRYFTMLGYKYGELPMNFETWENLLHPEDKETVAPEIMKKVKKGEPFEVEFRLKCKDGSWKWISGQGKGYKRSKDGKLYRAVGLHVDISSRKQIENDLRKAKEKAEENDRLKSAFLANMSHEIRTPMNGILGFVSLLEDPDLSEKEQDKYMEVIRKSGERMLNTVNDLIEISKIEAGQTEIHETEVVPAQKLEELFTFFKPEFDKKGLKLSYSIPEEILNLSVNTDETKLHSVLTNLIKNALKYTEKGTVKLGCQHVQGKLEFFVEDTGIGIHKNRQKAVFDRFVQADIGDRKVFEGSGLGLAIAKSYVKMLGGKMRLKSEAGKGSLFCFTIPLTRVKTRDTGKKKQNMMPKRPGEIKEKPVILIVEDDTISMQHLEILLMDKAQKILHASDGRQAVQICRKNPQLNLILMDIKIPLINGYEATKQIRQFNTQVKIIAQTAYALEGDREKALAAGCDEYISKPIEKETLFRMMNQLLSKGEQSTDAAF